ncbi:MAG: hypothetical protein ACPG4Z_01125 [Chitinophagales bacterium]
MNARFFTPLLFSFLLFFACAENNASKDIEESQVEEESVVAEQYFHVDNLDDYSDEFIEEMREISLPSLELKGDMMIVENDTQYFPQHPTIGEYQVYTALQDTLAIALSIERLNYTTIEYKLEMVKFGEASYEEEGLAELSPNYFFIVEDSKFKYKEDKYFYVINDTCNTFIQFKNINDSTFVDSELNFLINCSKNGVNSPINESNFPALIRKN